MEPAGPTGSLALPFRPTPFFADKNRAFWNLQLIGWGGSMLMRAVTNIANGKPPSFLVLTLIATITGFSISLLLSVIYAKLIRQRPLITWGATALVLALAVGVAAFIEGWTIWLWQGGGEGNFASLVLGVFYIEMTLLGAWSALYYAINYYLQVEQQADRLERLEAQATSAVSAGLRLPHSWDAMAGQAGSASVLCSARQCRQGVTPGSTTGPMRTLVSPKTTARWGTSRRSQRPCSSGSITNWATITAKSGRMLAFSSVPSSPASSAV